MPMVRTFPKTITRLRSTPEVHWKLDSSESSAGVHFPQFPKPKAPPSARCKVDSVGAKYGPLPGPHTGGPTKAHMAIVLRWLPYGSPYCGPDYNVGPFINFPHFGNRREQ